ncbi:hypothetical protein ACFL0M_04700 [Thermodesulfobacteriota bacterium]
MEFKLTERIPVSELEQVQVKIGQLPRNAEPDKDGFVRLSVNLAPMSEKSYVSNIP